MNPLVATIIGALLGGFIVSGGDEKPQKTSQQDLPSSDT
jgi:hypothetical protein